MKKILLSLGVFAVLSFMACDSDSDSDLNSDKKSDCECVISFMDIDVSLDVLDFAGDCSNIGWNDLPAQWQEGEGLEGYSLYCTEK
ncbi:MAG: hypothetical protein LBM25_07575 [Bacteroidales bacterium]|jgi:hypothetical protein|nr:hypothetical protein [Bacteroidales bacterium]